MVVKISKNSPLLKLYWVTTPDHDEDWFVVSRTKRDAERFFEDYEGYSRGYASAELVCRVPGNPHVSGDPGHPSEEIIKACGGVINQRERNILHEQLGCGMRTVDILGKRYSEGDIVKNVVSQMPVADGVI